MLTFDGPFGNIAAESPVKFQNNRTTVSLHLAASRFRENCKSRWCYHSVVGLTVTADLFHHKRWTKVEIIADENHEIDVH